MLNIKEDIDHENQMKAEGNDFSTLMVYWNEDQMKKIADYSSVMNP